MVETVSDRDGGEERDAEGDPEQVEDHGLHLHTIRRLSDGLV